MSKKLIVKQNLYTYLQKQYKDIVKPEELHKFIENYVDGNDSRKIFKTIAPSLKSKSTLLDLGCGYGNFVAICRENGIDALGIDIDEHDVTCAKLKFKNHAKFFQIGDARILKYKDRKFDYVTMWNLLEHLPDTEKVILEAFRVLKKGGRLFLVCPNYAAFRNEAHYHVPWIPLIPKQLASIYLRLIGKNPDFLNNNIFYTTNTQINRMLNKTGFSVIYPKINIEERIKNPKMIENHLLRGLTRAAIKYKATNLVSFAGIVLNSIEIARFLNPFKTTIYIEAIKN